MIIKGEASIDDRLAWKEYFSGKEIELPFTTELPKMYRFAITGKVFNRLITTDQ